jgi:hypothetical protein
MTEYATPFSGLARGLRIAAAFGAAALPLIVVAAIAVPQRGAPVTATIEAGGLPPGWGAALALVYTLLVSMALVELCRMLRRVEQGDAFSPVAIRHFRRFAAWLSIAALAAILLPAIAVLSRAALADSGGARLDLDGGDALFLLLSVLMFLIARLFEAAARYQEDSREIV